MTTDYVLTCCNDDAITITFTTFVMSRTRQKRNYLPWAYCQYTTASLMNTRKNAIIARLSQR